MMTHLKQLALQTLLFAAAAIAAPAWGQSCNDRCESTIPIVCCSDSDCRCERTSILDRLKRSDHCFDCMISPMTNSIYFEDPRTLTEARLLFIHHQLPGAVGGSDVNVMAMQLRAALSDRLSFIATKDGYITSTNALIDDGWADINAGLKYNLFKDHCNQRILSAGATYELPVGSRRSLQGNGDGMFHLFLSGGSRIACWNWISGSGIHLPVDDAAESTLAYWSNHFSRQIADSNVHGLIELNWYHWLSAGAGGIPGVEGGDLINLGSSGVAGNNIVTAAFGTRYKPSRHTEIGLAFEVPLTDRRDVLEDRITFDWIFRY